MSEFDKDVKKALSEDSSFDMARGSKQAKQAVGVFNARLRKVERITWGYLVGCTAVLVFSIVRFLHSTDTKHQILYLGIFILALAMQVLMKLWYWVMNTKLSVLRELKQLRLAMPAAEASKSSSGDVDTAAEERVMGLSKLERRIWWIFLLAVALGVALLSSAKIP